MRWILSVATLLFVILLGTSRPAVQADTFPTLYDNFAGELIDPNRWISGGTPRGGYETNVGQDDGRLRIELRAYGDIGASSPQFPPLQGRIHFLMTRPASATAIQVTTRVDEVTTTGCGSSQPSRTQARIVGNFFRDGPTPSNPFDNTGVVFVANQIVSRPELPAGTLVVNFFASRCLDFNCDTDVDIGFGSFVNVAPKQAVTLGIELDAAHNRLIFTKDAETQVIPNVAAFQINTDLRDLHFKKFEARHRLETCPTRAMGFVDVSFTNFRIKP